MVDSVDVGGMGSIKKILGSARRDDGHVKARKRSLCRADTSSGLSDLSYHAIDLVILVPT